jgi:hypothetical protein
MKNSCFGPECTIFQGSKVAKHAFYCVRPKMMFGSVPEHFAKLRYIKRCKCRVSGLNALYRGAELEWYPFYYIGTKMMLGSVSEHFANLRHIKTCNSCVSGLNALF